MKGFAPLGGAASAVPAACDDFGFHALGIFTIEKVVSSISTSWRSIVRRLAVCEAIVACAGVLSAQATPASDNGIPMTNVLPPRMFSESFERLIPRLMPHGQASSTVPNARSVQNC